MQPFVSTVNHTGIVVEKKLFSGSKWAGYTASVSGIQMSAVARTKMFGFGCILSLSVQDIFLPHKEGRVRVHIATELTADWTEGVLKPFAAHKVYYSFLSVWQ